MVGDRADELGSLSSDPYTPLLVIQQRPRYTQEWRAANIAVDTLFAEKKYFPWQVYDRMLLESRPTRKDCVREITINETPFTLTTEEGRCLY